MKKTPTGVGFFDLRYGGIPSGRSMLLTGYRGAGKSMFCLQFLRRGLELGEPTLILSARPSRELAMHGKSVGIEVDAETEKNRLFIMNYGDIIQASQREQDIMLPPEGFIELKDIIERRGIQRVALDTVIPWMNLTTKGHLAEHVVSFVRAFERMKTTAVFTLYQPVAPAALKLHSLLEEAVPVAVTVDYDSAAGTRFWRVDKYSGEKVESQPRRIKIDPKIGVVPMSEVGDDWQVDYSDPRFGKAEADKPKPQSSGFSSAWGIDKAAGVEAGGKTPKAVGDQPGQNGQGSGSKPQVDEELKLRSESDNQHPDPATLRTPFARAMFSDEQPR